MVPSKNNVVRIKNTVPYIQSLLTRNHPKRKVGTHSKPPIPMQWRLGLGIKLNSIVNIIGLVIGRYGGGYGEAKVGIVIGRHGGGYGEAKVGIIIVLGCCRVSVW